MKIQNHLSKKTARITKATTVGITTLVLLALLCLGLQPVFANSSTTKSLSNSTKTSSSKTENTANTSFTKDKLPEPKDYPVNDSLSFKGKPKPVDLNSHPEAKQYRTKLSEGAAKGPNFAGHYTIVSIGAGTMVQMLWIIDANTGKIITTEMQDGSKEAFIVTSLGGEYSLNSRLLITNPPKEVKEFGFDADWIGKNEYFVLEDGKMKKIFEVKASEILDSKHN